MDNKTENNNTIDLQTLRDKIDIIDRQLLPLFLERMEVCGKVAEYKIRTGMKVFDPVREKQVLDNKLSLLDDPSYQSEVYEFFNNIMTISRIRQAGIISESRSKDGKIDEVESLIEKSKLNKNNLKDSASLRVACFGEEGSYTEEAAIDYFGEDFKELRKTDFRSVLNTLTQNKDSDNDTADFAVVPIENSSTGTIEDVAELISTLNLYIVGEVRVPVRHCLVGTKDSDINNIKAVYSHSQALMQCSEFLNTLNNTNNISLNEYTSTAAAAKYVSEKGDNIIAAIASPRTAKLYGLKVLSDNITDNNCNTTRFAVTSPYPHIDEECNKISMVFTLKHESGELYRILGAFARCGLNLLKLESRPISDKPFEYRFYADITGNLLNQNVKSAIKEVISEVQSFKILGCYKEYKL